MLKKKDNGNLEHPLERTDKLFISNIDISARSSLETDKNEGLYIHGHGITSIRISSENYNDAWVEGALNSPSVSLLVNDFGKKPKLRSIEFVGITVGPSSFGQMDVSIPNVCLTVPDEGDVSYSSLSVKGPILVSFQSLPVVQNIRTFVMHWVGSDEMSSKSDFDFSSLPNKISIPMIKLKVLDDSKMQIVVENSIVTGGARCEIGALKLHEMSQGVSTSISKVSAMFGEKQDVQIHVSVIESLAIRGVGCIYEPVRDSVVMFRSYELLLVKIPSLRFAQEEICDESRKNQKAVKAVAQPREKNILPFPLRLIAQEVSIKTSPKCKERISFYGVDLVAKSGKGSTFDLESKGNTDFQLEEEMNLAPSKCLLKGTLGPSSTALFEDTDGFVPIAMDIGGAHISLPSSSCVLLDVTIPAISLSQDNPQLCAKSALVISMQSYGIVDHVQRLISKYLQVDSKNDTSLDEFLFPFVLPKASVTVVEPNNIQVFAESIELDGLDLKCKSLQINEEKGISGSISGISAISNSSLSKIHLNIGAVESLYVPGVMTLSKPLFGTKFMFEKGCLQIEVKTVSAIILDQTKKEDEKVTVSSGVDGQTLNYVKFPIRLVVQEVCLKKKSVPQKSSKLFNINLEVKRVRADLFDENSPQGLSVKVTLGRMENDMLQLSNLESSAFVRETDHNVIRGFTLIAEYCVIRAGYSSMDWSKLFGKGDNQKPSTVLMMPFASVSPLTVTLSFNGKVVSAKETTLLIDPFTGGPKTDSNEVTKYYLREIMARAPGIFSNTEVMGKNVLDTTASTAARMTMKATAKGAAAGSVIGIAALDGMRGAIAAGKKSRNASVNEGYKFGDFTRGASASIKAACKAGAEQRRGERESNVYRPLDFSVGASKAAGGYVSENKERLGSAGGGGAGAVVGAAILGPVGFVAGSMLGSKLGGKTFEGGNKSSETSSTLQVTKEVQREDVSVVRISQESTETENAKPSHHSPLQPIQTVIPKPQQSSSNDLLDLENTRSLQSAKKESEKDKDWFALAGLSSTQNTSQPLVLSSPNNTGNSINAFAPVPSIGTSPTCPPSKTHNSYAFEKNMWTETKTTMTQTSFTQTQNATLHHGSSESDQMKMNRHQAQTATMTHIQCTRHTSSHHQVQNIHHGTQHHQAHQNQAMNQNYLQQQAYQEPHTVTQTRGGQEPEQRGYRFGDFTKSIVKKGKEKSGRSEKDSYKFGDFTRGLFK